MDRIFNSISDNVLIIGNDGIIKFCNNILLQKFQYESNEIIGMHANKVLHHSNDFQSIMKNFQSDKNSEIILRFIKENNSEIRCMAKIIKDNWFEEEAICIISKDCKEKLYTREQVEFLLDELQIPIGMLDSMGKYVYVNKVAAKNFKIPKENFIGNSEEGVYGDEIGKHFSDLNNKVIETKQPRIDKVKVITGDGKVKWIETYRSPIIGDNGEVDRIIKTFKDISLKETLNLEVKKSFDLISTFNNILKNDIEDESIESSLNNIKNYLMNYLNADGINIWVYDNETEYITSEVRNGVFNNMINQDISFKINKDNVSKAFDDTQWEGMKPLGGQVDILTYNELKKHDIRYRGVYKISYGDEFLGTLGIVYKNLNTNMVIQDDLIKSVCDQIGFILKNKKLSLDVKKEFNKRIDVEKELEDFLETTVDMVALIDGKGNFVKVNSGWVQTLGWNKEELLGMSFRDFVDKDDVDFTANLGRLTKGREQLIRGVINRYRCKNGEAKWLEWSFKYKLEKEIFICTARDITKQKIAEDQKKMYEKSLELESIKNEFFSNISHEFKTPLNIILATMQLINKNIENNKITASQGIDLSRYMTSIRQNSYRLLRLVNNLIDMTRIDTGYYKLNLENHNIVEVIEDITMSVAQFIEDKGISLVFDTEIEEEIIACDPDKIERIMLNLLSNAIKYTSVNGKIDVNIGVDDNKIIVSVKDDGIGIPQEKVKTIFERFIQVDNSLTRKNQGSGIGLSLVKSLVEMHGGTIEVRSEEGKGTEFIFSMPITTVELDSDIKLSESTLNTRVEKCNVEFSDIYEA